MIPNNKLEHYESAMKCCLFIEVALVIVRPYIFLNKHVHVFRNKKLSI